MLSRSQISMYRYVVNRVVCRLRAVIVGPKYSRKASTSTRMHVFTEDLTLSLLIVDKMMRAKPSLRALSWAVPAARPVPRIALRGLFTSRPALVPKKNEGRPSMPQDTLKAEEVNDQGMSSYAIADAVNGTTVDAYLEQRLLHPDYALDPSLARGIERANEAGMPKIAINALQGQFLTILAKGIKAEKILEIGTLAG